MLSCVGDHILQEFNDQIQNLQSCYTTPNKILEGRGPQTDKRHLAVLSVSLIFLRLSVSILGQNVKIYSDSISRRGIESE